MSNAIELQKQLIAMRVQHLGLELPCSFSGPINAKIVIIGEYPGENEIAFGKPLIGPTGKILKEHLRRNGISAHQCYMTNAVKRRVSTQHPVSKHEKTLWQDVLQLELSNLTEATHILCLGSLAMELLLDLDSITQRRGSVYEYNNIPVYITNNPAVIFRNPANEIVFSFDINKFKKLVNGDYKHHNIERIINPTFEQAMQYINDIKQIHKRFSTDIEVIGMETACIGLAHSANHAMCINFRNEKENRYTIKQEYEILRAFANLCDDPTTTVIAQNGNFDSYFMGYKDDLTFEVNFDTLLAHHTLYPTLPHNLGFLTAQYTFHPFYKDEKDIFKEGGDINAFWEYNCTDCAITFAVAEEEEKELKEQGLYDFFINHVMKLQPELSYATATGIKVNSRKKDQLAHDLNIELEKLLDAFHKSVHEATGDDTLYPNPSSPKQMNHLLFDVLNLKAKKRSMDAQTREELIADRRTDPFAKDVLLKLSRYAEERKFVSTYVNSVIDHDGRFRSEFKQYGVQSAPGRLSSGKTLWGSGGNAQNQPHRAYEMYTADEGCVFIYFDLAQAEARYVAWDAWIEQWIQDFEKARVDGSFDAHRSLASTMFDVPYDQVPKDDFLDANGLSQKKPDHDPATLRPTMRYVAKRCRHGLNYRMMPHRLAQTTGMSYGEAVRNFQIYHKTNPELSIWWDKLEQEVKKTKMQFNYLGRRNVILGRLNDDTLKSIVAFKPQSSIGDKVQRVWYQCHSDERWDKYKARIAINVHDALWGIATPDYAKTALSIMKAYAEEPLLIKSTVTGKTNDMIIPADMKISIPDQYGQHLMSNMRDIDIEPVSI